MGDKMSLKNQKCCKTSADLGADGNGVSKYAVQSVQKSKLLRVARKSSCLSISFHTTNHRKMVLWDALNKSGIIEAELYHNEA